MCPRVLPNGIQTKADLVSCGLSKMHMSYGPTHKTIHKIMSTKDTSTRLGDSGPYTLGLDTCRSLEHKRPKGQLDVPMLVLSYGFPS
jgi:hypothetical protein